MILLCMQVHVTEHHVGTSNLVLVTPNFTEYPQNQPFYRRTLHATSQSCQQAYPTESWTNHHNDNHPTAVSNYSPRRSQANHCDNFNTHPTHCKLPTRRTRLDEGRQSQTSVDDKEIGKGYKVVHWRSENLSNPILRVIP